MGCATQSPSSLQTTAADAPVVKSNAADKADNRAAILHDLTLLCVALNAVLKILFPSGRALFRIFLK